MALSRTQRLLIPVGFFVVIGLIIYSTTGLAKFSCNVCIEFRGQRICKSAAATTKQDATETAKQGACADVAFGRDDSIACNQATPILSATCTE